MKEKKELKENTDQHKFFFFISLLEKIKEIADVKDNIGIVNNKPNYFPNRERPDILIHEANKPKIAYNCWFAVELLLSDPNDKEHKVRTAEYNRQILEERCCRNLIISMVTNLNEMLLIKTKRDENGRILHFESHKYGKHIITHLH